ncbi:hemerythrin HHE cation binding domain-containing protein [Amylocystis lapponica]|nr:hemerythrin HHE cation binding domain-containing protein [Amylocystis lapponica]
MHVARRASQAIVSRKLSSTKVTVVQRPYRTSSMFNVSLFDSDDSGGLSAAAQEQRWNGPSRKMDYFHTRLLSEFNKVYALADGTFEKHGMSLQRYLRVARQLVEHLTVHHTIEERYIFPKLAERMPVFADNETHIKSHEKIHEGLDELSALIRKWNKEPSSYSPAEMRTSLDGWREVLVTHLADEVRQQDLGPENLKKYWTLQEVHNIPI